MTAILARLSTARRHLRWHLWVALTRLRLRRVGMELVVEAPHPPEFHRLPRIELTPQPFAAPVRRPGTGRLTLRLAPAAHLGSGTVLELRGEGEHLLQMASRAYLQGNVRLGLFDGEVVFGEDVRVRDGAVVRCSGRLEVGARGGINNHTVVHCANRVVLGEGSHLAERCSALDSDHSHDGSDTWMMAQPTLVGEVVIGDNVLVGAGCVVLRDAHIGRNSLVAAGAVVRAGEYPESSLLAGSPARVVRSLRPEEVAST